MRATANRPDRYEIVRGLTPPPVVKPRKTKERLTMEALSVGDGFLVSDYDASQRARWACNELRPKRFSIRKVPKQGWVVSRVADSPARLNGGSEAEEPANRIDGSRYGAARAKPTG